MARETVLIDHVKRLEIEEERLPIFEALILLEEVNKQTILNKSIGSCRIRIYNHKNHLLHSMELQFPLKDAIEEIISGQYQIVRSKKKTTKSKAAIRTKKAIKYGEPSRSTKGKLLSLIPTIIRVWFIVVIVFSLFIGISVMWPHFITKVDQKEITTTEEQEWANLIEAQAYLQAATEYPEKRHELIDYLTEQQEFTWLKEINEYYPTADAQFDLAFFEKNWEVVIETSPENLSDKRKVMLAFAYIELEQLAEAEILNKYLESEELSKKLDQNYLQKGLFFLKQKKIAETTKHLELIQEEEVKKILQTYIEQASIIIDFIELYQQNEDPENQLLWEQRLEMIGQSDINDRE